MLVQQDRSFWLAKYTVPGVANCNEKNATMEISKPKACVFTAAPSCKVLFTLCVCAGRLCCLCWTFVLLVLEVRAACPRGSCCLCWRFVQLVLEIRAARAGGSCSLCWRFALLVLKVVLEVLEVLKACAVCRSWKL